ncbi:phage head completion protein [Planococcus kocurii]|uniref:phage head completion protein n=1 Tax=Planococcus kocurii TaxID=1374 RepID=UPI003D017A63
MIKFEHKPRRVNSGDLRTPVTFYKLEPNDGPEAGEEVTVELYSCYAEVTAVWRKDLEQAKANGTLEDVTLKIRNPYESYQADNKDSLRIGHPQYAGKEYSIKSVQPDPQDSGFVIIVAGLTV